MIEHPIIRTEKYIPLDQIDISEGRRVLIDAETGTGKTTLAMSMPQTEEYRIILFPTIAIGKNKRAPDEMSGLDFYYDGNVPDYNFEKSWMATFDNILKIPTYVLKDARVYIDEVHLIASSQYRTSMPEIIAYIFKYAKTVVGLSGTIKPKVLDSIFDEKYTVRRRVPQEVTITNITCGYGTDQSKFALVETFEWLNTGYNVMLIMQDKANLKEYAKNVRGSYFNEPAYDPEDEPNQSAVIKYVSEESKRTAYNSEDAHRMIETGQIGEHVRVICGTSVLAQGWDLHHSGKWVVIVAGDTHRTDHLKMPDTLKQIAARFRNVASVNVRVQRNAREGKVENISFDEKRVIGYVQQKRKQRANELQTLHHSYHTPLRRYTFVEEIEGGEVKSFTQVPLLEACESAMNRAHKYGTLEYSKLAEKIGIIGVYEDEFQYSNEGKYSKKMTMREVSNSVLKNGFVPSDEIIDQYLRTGKDDLIDEVTDQFIYTAKQHGINARPRLDTLRWLLDVYDKTSLLQTVTAIDDNLEYIVSIDQIESYAKNKLLSITKYEIRDLLIDNFEGKAVELKQIKKSMARWSDKYFLGYEQKQMHIASKTAETLIGTFVNYQTIRKHGGRLYLIVSDEDIEIRGDALLKFNDIWIGEQLSSAIESRMKKFSPSHSSYSNLMQKWKTVGIQGMFDDLDAIAS